MVSQKRKWRALLLIILTVVLMAACSSNSGGNAGDAGGGSNTANTGGTAGSGNANTSGGSGSSGGGSGGSRAEEPFDPMAKYDPPITITTVSGQDLSLKFAAGEDWEKNAVYDMYEKHLGVKIKNEWVVDSTQLSQKLKVTIASGEIPDIMKVFSIEDVYTLAKAGLIYDLTDVYEKYATEEAKAFMTEDGGRQLDSAKINGRLMAIPLTNSPYNAAQFLFVRKDWLDKLGLPEPKTMQDVLNISRAFKENDLGGNGTYGFAFRGDIFSTVYSAKGFFNGFHAYPGQWIVDESGSLAYGSIQPEMKEALKALQDMHRNGELDPEFGVKGSQQMIELISQEKLGLIYGEFWNPSSMQAAVVKDGVVTQEWAVYPLVSIDDKPALSQTTLGVGGYYVVSAKSRNPEAAIKMLNLRTGWIKTLPQEDQDIFAYGYPGTETQDYYKLNPIYVYSQSANVRGGVEIPRAIETGDTSRLSEFNDWKVRYQQAIDYEAGDTTKWGGWMAAKPGGTLALVAYYKENDLFHFDRYLGPPTPTQVERNATLNAKELEVFTKIILNQAPIDEFDKFVEEWKKLGGEQIPESVIFAKSF
jgi:putative aldouronate transport system substrate-binding protein